MQVSCSDICMLRFVTARQHAYSMLLCVTHAAEQERSWSTLVLAPHLSTVVASPRARYAASGAQQTAWKRQSAHCMHHASQPSCCCSRHAQISQQTSLQRPQAHTEVDTALQSTRGRGTSAQRRQRSAAALLPHSYPRSTSLLRFQPPDTLSRAAHAILAAVVHDAIAQLAAAPLAGVARAPSMPNAA